MPARDIIRKVFSKDTARKVIGKTSTAGATISLSLLGGVGIAPFIPSTVAIIFAFVLIAAYENQVNGEGIGSALKRLFDKQYLALGIVERFLDELIEEQLHSETAISDNLFYQEYKAQLDYIEKWEAYIAQQEQIKHAHAFYDRENKKRLKIEIEKSAEDLKQARERLRELQLVFLDAIYGSTDQKNKTGLQIAAAELGKEVAPTLKKEIRNKLRWIRAGSIFAAGAGTFIGIGTIGAIYGTFATLGAVGGDAAAFLLAGLSAVPFGIFGVLAVLAGVGYALLMYQGFSDLVQAWQKNGKGFFNKRENESRRHYFFRYFCGIVVIGLSLLATIATAGTWASNLQSGGVALLNFTNKAADVLEKIAFWVITLINFPFNSHNSVSSTDDIFESNYSKLFAEKITNPINNCWEDEVSSQKGLLKIIGALRFSNPFRAIGRFLSLFGKSALFGGHIASVGVTADQVDLGRVIPGVPDAPDYVSAGIVASVEGLSDAAYLPNKKGGHAHHHESFLLKVLFAPVTLTVGTLKFFAAVWDYLFSPSEVSFRSALDNMFVGVMPNPKKLLTSPATWRAPEFKDGAAVLLERLKLPLPPSEDISKGTRVTSFERTATQKRLSNNGVSIASHRGSLFNPSKVALRPNPVFSGKGFKLGASVH